MHTCVGLFQGLGQVGFKSVSPAGSLAGWCRGSASDPPGLRAALQLEGGGEKGVGALLSPIK